MSKKSVPSTVSEVTGAPPAVSEVSMDMGVPPTMGVKHDSGKPMFHCMDAEALLQLGAVAAYGAQKYGDAHGDSNWRAVPDAPRRYFDAAMRHLLASRTHLLDTESGQAHLAHAAWNCLACLALAKGAPNEH